MVSMNQVGQSAIGCVIGLAMWKATREQPLLAICGIVILAATFGLSDKYTFPFDLLILIAGFGLLHVGKVFLVDRKKPSPDTPSETQQ